MVRGRGGQNNQSRGQNMGTRTGRVMKNNSGANRPNSTLDFGFSNQTKSSYSGPKQNRNSGNFNSGGFNSSSGGYNSNPNSGAGYNNSGGGYNNSGGGYNSNPNSGGGYNSSSSGGYNSSGSGGYNKTNSGGYTNSNPNSGGGYNNQNRNNQQSGNVGQNNSNNRRFSSGNQNKPFSGNTNNNQQRGNHYNPNNRNQGQNQNYSGSNSNKPFDNNQGSNQVNNQNQGYRRPNQNQNNSGPQPFNNNRNTNFNQVNPAFANRPSPFVNNTMDQKPSLLGKPNAGGPPANSDEIFKELGKALLTSMAAGAPNPMANMMPNNPLMGPGPLPGGPPAHAQYDNFYNHGNQYTNFNPPSFQNYRGGYNNNARVRGTMRGGVGNRSGMYNNTRGFRNYANNNSNNKRTPGTPNAGVKKQSFKAKDNNKGGKQSPRSIYGKTIKATLSLLDKSVDASKQPLAAFLKQTFYDVSADNKTHFVLLSRILLKNVNVVKLLAYEVKKGLDRKFGEGSEDEVLKKKMDFLNEKKKKFVSEYKLAFKDAANFDEKEKLIEDMLPILAGKEFNSENIPKPEDYVVNAALKEEDYTINFKMAFIKSAFENFFYRLNFSQMPTKKIEKRFQFHIDNGFLSHLIVDKVKLKTNTKLPAVLAKYCKALQNTQMRNKVENAIKNGVETLTKKDEQQQTDISDYIANEKVSAEVLRDFADCIILFDKVATAIKFKLVFYTPYINLSEEKKKELFKELVKTIYSEVLNILKNNISSSKKKFEDMVKDADEDEKKDLTSMDEDVHIKEESAIKGEE